MKKILCSLLVLSMTFAMLFSATAVADSGIDFSDYSLEELVSLRADLDNEIEKQLANLSTTLIPGTYVVGRDITAGSYLLLGLMDKGPNGYTPQALVAESEEDAEYSEYTEYNYMKNGDKWRISVEEGNVIEIRVGDVSIQNAQPLTCGENINPNDPSLLPTSNLAPGRYVVGKDINAGTYVLLGLMDEGPTGYTPQALISESVDDVLDSDYIDYEYMKTGDTWRITLQLGNVLEIRTGDVAVQEMEPLAFAPELAPEEKLSDLGGGESEGEETLEGSPLIKGVYVAGRDLQAGSYNITMTDCSKGTIIATFANKDDMSSYTSWNSASNLGKYSKTALYVKEGQTNHVFLEDGDYLYIEDGSGIISETDNSTLVRGIYHVGKELTPGSYFITLTDFHNSAEVATFASSSDLVAYTSWDSVNNLKEYSTVYLYAEKNETFHITLIEGEYLYIGDGKGDYVIN